MLAYNHKISSLTILTQGKHTAVVNKYHWIHVSPYLFNLPFPKLVFLKKNTILLNSGHTEFIWILLIHRFCKYPFQSSQGEEDYKQCLGSSCLFHSQTCNSYFKAGEIDKSFKDGILTPWMGSIPVENNSFSYPFSKERFFMLTFLFSPLCFILSNTEVTFK